ncbi:MAG TPA: FG-GAP-like repeat-containing protein [Candidatus Thermoplasmatota archaeon]|nr:FG-GAP-like repeat-containing protein [Candidatus Thermoplasmatota archaeon]
MNNKRTHDTRLFASFLIAILCIMTLGSSITQNSLHAVKVLTTSQITFVEKSTGLNDPAKEGGNTELELFDVNQDGNPDIISVGDHGNPYINTQEHGIMVYLNNDDGTWTVHQDGDFGYGGCALGDLNLDGHPDIVWGIHHNYGSTGYGDTLVGAALGDGTGTAWTGWATGLGSGGETYGMFNIDLADFNNDGLLDIIVQSFGYGNGYHVYKNNGDGTWTHRWTDALGNTNNDLKACDINADGNMDFVGTKANTYVYLGDGAFGFTLTQNGLPSAVALGLDRGDVNGDGCDDLIIAYDNLGVRCYLFDKGTSSWTSASTGLPTTGDYNVQCGDLNGDGSLDILAYSGTTAHVYLGDGTGNWISDATFMVGSPGDYSALRIDGDFDHDGREDVLIQIDQGSWPSELNTLRAFSPWSEPTTLSVHVKSPHGGETFKGNSVRDIRWLSAIPPAQGASQVDLELSLNGVSGPWITLARNIPDDGRYQWSVPGTSSSHCRIKVVVHTASSSAEAISPADFTIIGGCIADAHGPYAGKVDVPVQFTGSAQNGVPPYHFHWTFGDGTSSEDQNVSHEYVDAGNFTVVLKVTDEEGATAFDATWALISMNNTAPETPLITGPAKAKTGTPVTYTVSSADPEGDAVFYRIDWGDNASSGWLGPYPSGLSINQSHTWNNKGVYTIRCQAKDIYGNESAWGTLRVTMPLSYELPGGRFLERLLERFPHAFPFLRFLLH